MRVIESNIRVQILSKSNIIKLGIRSLFESIKGIFIVDESNDPSDFLIKVSKVKPDLIVFDPYFFESQMYARLKRFCIQNQDIKLIAFTYTRSNLSIFLASECKINALLPLDSHGGELQYAINIIFNDGQYYGPDLCSQKVEKIIDSFNSYQEFIDSEKCLSDRERKILYYISRGLTSREISTVLFTSKRTIDAHRSNMMKKLNLNSTTELVIFSVKYHYKSKKIELSDIVN